ncbi:MAG: alpha/beta hydrolase-fold protein [Pseudomonadota bacterium]
MSRHGNTNHAATNPAAAIVAALLALSGCGGPAGDAATTVEDRILLPAPLSMDTLDRERQIRVYLPPGYGESEQRYPVLYLHDGQNLFDDATAYAGEWGVDETLDALAREGLALIAVGIDNGGERRMTELNPWSNDEFGEGEGDDYLRFVVDRVKPYVDEHYRTRPGRLDTAVIGSSMGGFISHYAMLEYSAVFSKAGLFSPSYWIAEDIFPQTTESPPPADARLYLLVGALEGPDMQSDTERMAALLIENGHPEESLSLNIRPDGDHNEAFWRREFAAAVRWLFAPTP